MDDFPAQGLRERSKADRTHRILTAAMRLFRAVGYDAAKIEDIAAAADVAPGTLYNYFKTKGDILMAIVTMEVEEVLTEGEDVLDRPGLSLQQAADRLIGGYFDHSLTYLSKGMWRRAMALSISAPDTRFSQRYTRLDARLANQIAALIRRFQSGGHVWPDVTPDVAAEVIFNNLNNMFIEFVKSDTMTMDELKSRTAAQTAVVVRGIARSA
jgi:AcrR family transcriptional regulator